MVFDSPTRAVTARAEIAEIRALTKKPVTVLINSHWHQDHWSGNDEYVKAFPGLRIVATEGTRDYMLRMPARYFASGIERSLATRRAELAAAIQTGSALARRLAAAIQTGKLADGSTLTPAVLAEKEENIAQTAQFAAEVAALPRVLPNVVFKDEMTFWTTSNRSRRRLRPARVSPS